MDVQYFQTSFETVSKEASHTKGVVDGDIKGTVIKGYVSTTTKDRYGDVVLPSAFEESIKTNYKNNPIILFAHDHTRPIGKCTYMALDEKGLYIEALIVDNEIEPKVQAGILKTFSIGFIPLSLFFVNKDGRRLDPASQDDRAEMWLDTTTRYIDKLDLLENSIVSTPANPDALFTLEKSLKDMFDKKRKSVDGLCGIVDTEKEILNNNNDMGNLLKEATEEVVEEVTEEVVEEVVEETPTEEVKEETPEAETEEVIVDETSDTDEDGETDVEVVEVEEDIATEDEEKAALLEEVKELKAKTSELEAKLAKQPVKKGLANVGVGSVEEAKAPTGMDFKQAFLQNKL